jgi:hypothetical protein
MKLFISHASIRRCITDAVRKAWLNKQIYLTSFTVRFPISSHFIDTTHWLVLEMDWNIRCMYFVRGARECEVLHVDRRHQGPFVLVRVAGLVSISAHCRKRLPWNSGATRTVEGGHDGQLSCCSVDDLAHAEQRRFSRIKWAARQNSLHSDGSLQLLLSSLW